MFKNKKLILALSIIPQYLIVKLLSQYPEFVETYYSHGIYQFVSKTMRYMFGWIPFSVGDILLGLLIIYVIRWLIVNRKRIIKDFKAWLIDILCAVSIAYFAFYFLWGMNYYRLPIHKTLNIDTEYSTEDLIDVTKKLIVKSNAIHIAITNSEEEKVTIPYNRNEILKMMSNGYSELAKVYPQLQYTPKSAKICTYNSIQAYMGFSGYLNPFTNEAQVNGLVPLYKLPDTAGHEAAHQIGYAAENETNFIGNLATMYNNDIYFKYSGYLSALKDCLNEVYRRDKLQYGKLIISVNIGIRENYQDSREFWKMYENPFEPFFKKSYNTFLKANNQDKGIESYSYVVALLVNYFKDKSL
ncbi:DUF3810 family protein [Flavobacteriaceae bacterium AU392]|nr:DUF3810 domain-containing protein [Flavobacteriaceae bacterium]RKM83685.1 DUF3810 family protein [Flavobacteriaceae bacterium AU392]